MDRHPLILTRQSTGLLIIDVQDKFKPVIPDIDDVVENITKLILAFQMYEMPVIVTEQYPKGLGNTIEIIEEQFKFIEIIEKLSFSCCGEPEFVKQMEKLSLKTVVVTGVETHVCVNQTVLDLLHAGYRVHVIADAVSSRHKTDYEIALRKMEKAGEW